MGDVFKARDTRLDRIVALKISREEFTPRFETEARVARSELNAQRGELAREIASRVLGREVQG